jgi:GH15 family glucan-1,4-alpha-glucosidase
MRAAFFKEPPSLANALKGYCWFLAVAATASAIYHDLNHKSSLGFSRHFCQFSQTLPFIRNFCSTLRTKNHYPKEAKNYFYVWPRDASFTCIAADILKLDIHEKIFDWLEKRAEGWNETGLFYEKYCPNGLQSLNRFQPDQTGTVLFAVWHHIKTRKANKLKYKKLIIKSAQGICDIWDKDHFALITNDLWEEMLCFPDLKENFMYSLAACIKGLGCANELFPNEKYDRTAKEMKKVLIRATKRKNYFF